jgi:hypothetical protein
MRAELPQPLVDDSAFALILDSLAVIATVLMLSPFPALACQDDWCKYDQPGPPERVRDADMTEPQRAKVDQHMKQNQVDLAIEAHTKRPQPTEYYREAYRQCMGTP